MTGPATTRRQALVAGAAGAGALALPSLARSAVDKDAQKKLERRVVTESIHGEQTKMVAFEAIANGRLLGARETATIRVLDDHATQHASLLTTLLKDELGADAPLAPKRARIPGLLSLRDGRAALRLSLSLERQAIGAHVAATGALHEAQILKAIARIVGSDGQHLVLLRQLLREQPVPSAFERGTA